MNDQEIKACYPRPEKMSGGFAVFFICACALLYLTMGYGKTHPTLMTILWCGFLFVLFALALRMAIMIVQDIWGHIKGFFGFLRYPFK